MSDSENHIVSDASKVIEFIGKGKNYRSGEKQLCQLCDWYCSERLSGIPIDLICPVRKTMFSSSLQQLDFQNCRHA